MKHRANNNFVKVPEPWSVSQYTHCIIHYVFEYDSNSLEMIICCFSVGRKIIQVCLNCWLRMAWWRRSAATWIREKKKIPHVKNPAMQNKIVARCFQLSWKSFSVVRFGFVFVKRRKKVTCPVLVAVITCFYWCSTINLCRTNTIYANDHLQDVHLMYLYKNKHWWHTQCLSQYTTWKVDVFMQPAGSCNFQ